MCAMDVVAACLQALKAECRLDGRGLYDFRQAKIEVNLLRFQCLRNPPAPTASILHRALICCAPCSSHLMTSLPP